MTTDEIDLTGAGSEITAPDSANETPEVAAPESNEAEQQPQEKPEQDDSDKSLKRLQRRVDRVTAARYQAEAKAQQLEAELARYRQQTQPEEVPQYRPEDIDRIATQRAQEIAQAQALQSRVTTVLEQGKAIPGFDDLCNDINAEVPFYEKGKPTAFLEAVLDSDKPHELLSYLGQNPDIAADLNGLSAARLGRRLEAIEREMKATKVSKAPAPIKPVTPKGAPVAKAESEMSDAEWYAARRKR